MSLDPKKIDLKLFATSVAAVAEAIESTTTKIRNGAAQHGLLDNDEQFADFIAGVEKNMVEQFGVSLTDMCERVSEVTERLTASAAELKHLLRRAEL